MVVNLTVSLEAAILEGKKLLNPQSQSYNPKSLMSASLDLCKQSIQPQRNHLQSCSLASSSPLVAEGVSHIKAYTICQACQIAQALITREE